MLLSSLLLVFVSTSLSTHGGDWLQFRGPDASSSAPNDDPPSEFDAASGKNIEWKIDLPGRSAAGAIVVGDQVVTTSSTGLDQRRIFITSYDKSDGKLRWEQVFVARGRPFCHPYSCNAAPTPASDGQRIFAFYSSNDLVCLGLDGELIWYRSLANEFPKAGNDTGMSSSPLVLNGMVLVQIESQGESFVAGIHGETGELVWKIDRPRSANWASPAPAKLPNGITAAVFTSNENVIVVEPQTGKLLFKLEFGASTISSALAVDNRLLLAHAGLTAVALKNTSGGNEESSGTKLWDNNKLEPGNSSPLTFGNLVVLVKGGVLSVGTVDTGELRYKIRLPDAGSIWSTPILCGERLFVFNDKGKCFVVKISNDKGEIVATSDLGEMVLGSPAVSDSALYVRSDRSLWKIAKK